MLCSRFIEDIATVIAEKYSTLSGVFTETTLRLWAALEARSLKHGSVSTVARAIGLSPGRPFVPGCQSMPPDRSRAPRCKRKEQTDGSGPPEEGARSWSKRMTRFCRTSMPHSIPSPGAIPCRRSAGPAKAPPDWPKV